ncbi:NUDIX hydrolase [Gymnodinialimonas sp. 2305UL16-5]|uniref:NUDIX hydrolase n=1 Tax=Gymnodinialimonas mytili TaxID=3126503 RepID=UPI00309F8767
MSQSGAKIILFRGASLISMLRDDCASIKFPNHWDLPGGGIEAGETPRAAMLREIREELGLDISDAPIIWEKRYPGLTGQASYFYAAPITVTQMEAIRFGDEGQRWELMPAGVFCGREDAVPHFRPRVAEFFASQAFRSAH